MRPGLLVVELWGMGDLVIATPFLQAASQKYEVTLLAKPYANDLQQRFWPGVRVRPFVAPWTAFRHKYRLIRWPWREILRLRELAVRRFDFGLSARWDPRDHLLLKILRVRRRFGFPRWKSQFFLSDPMIRPAPTAHRYEHWRTLARALELELPPREALPVARPRSGGQILIHTGAGQPVRVWPLERYRSVVQRLRQTGWRVQVACDPDQRQWWREAGETSLATPRNGSELLQLIERAAFFIGNDSGPCHLAAFSGVPTFTLFGPQLPEWFAPVNPGCQIFEGKPCPFKPCSDYCRFPAPYCMTRSTEPEVWERVRQFVGQPHPVAEPAPA